jgi:hypothetical protein
LKETHKKCYARDFARHLKEWFRGFRVIDIVSDSLGSSEGTSNEGFKSFIQVLREEDIQVRATTWEEKSDEDFIERIKDVLALPVEPNNFGELKPKLNIFSHNIGIITDIENVQWLKIRNQDLFKPKLDITNKDYLSCLKYALATNLHFDKDRKKIYRRTQGAGTYGIIAPKEQSQRYFKKKLGIVKAYKRREHLKEETWESF